MDIAQAINIATGIPMLGVLLYLLLKEQKAHTETRARIDGERREYWERYAQVASTIADLADRVAAAVERLDLPGPR